MNKRALIILLLITVLAGISIFAAGGVHAATSPVYTLESPLSTKYSSIGALLEGFMEIFTYIVIIAAVLLIIFVGLRFILIQGNSEKMKESAKWLGAIVIGVAIVIGARVILHIVINTLSATNTVSPGIINSANSALNNQQ